MWSEQLRFCIMRNSIATSFRKPKRQRSNAKFSQTFEVQTNLDVTRRFCITITVRCPAEFEPKKGYITAARRRGNYFRRRCALQKFISLCKNLCCSSYSLFHFFPSEESELFGFPGKVVLMQEQ